MKAEVLDLKRKAGIAGQFAVTVTFRYTDEEGDYMLTFVGSVYGEPGPVVMITASGLQTSVTEPERFGGTFGKEWVRRFVEGMGDE